MKIVMIAVGILLFIYIIYALFVRSVLKKYMNRSCLVDLGIDYGETYNTMLEQAAEWREQNPATLLREKSFDGLNLAAHWWDFSFDRTVIFIHGYGNSGEQAALMAPHFAGTFKMNILAPDSRAHGESDGEWISFGWPERKDILNWIDHVTQLKGPEHEIVLFGLSMGGATVLSAAGEALPTNVRAICSDCGYSSLPALFRHIMGLKHLPAQPTLHIINRLFKKWLGYSIYDVQPVDQVKKATHPILLIHGKTDSFIPVEMCETLYEACSSPEEILLVEGAGHALSSVVDSDRYVQTVASFFDSYLGAP